MFLTRVVAASAIVALSSLGAFAEAAQIATVSGRDQLALYDLATSAELARFARSTRWAAQPRRPTPRASPRCPLAPSSALPSPPLPRLSAPLSHVPARPTAASVPLRRTRRRKWGGNSTPALSSTALGGA